jgi:class 3 adenylate cyclase/predicted ATPase
MTCSNCQFDNPAGFAFCGKCGAPLNHRSDQFSQTDLDHLRAYLPASLIEALLLDPLSPAPVLLAQCTRHLAQLLETTTAYLPREAVAAVWRDPTPGHTGGEFVDGSLLFADISGFTAMSERLSQIGREGAEEVTAIVNRYFGVMLGILRAHGGQLIKFGGDALLGLFLEPESATRAVQAALHMQDAMREFAEMPTSCGSFPLQMKVGIHAGRFFAARLGTRRDMEFALLGSAVNATAAAESAALRGEVLISPAARAALTIDCTVLPVQRPAPYFVAADIDRRVVPMPDRASFIYELEPTSADIKRAAQLLDGLTPYLPAGLPGRIAADPQTISVEGEHRAVAVLFANVHGLGEWVDRLGPDRAAQIVTALNRYYVAMGNAIYRYGGVINKIDLYDRGDKLLAFFGAPFAHEDDAERAARAALEMQTALRDLDHDLTLTQQIGLNYGYVFAGSVGDAQRREYTVMGDEVNLAARLMSTAAPGEILASRAIQRKVQALFDLTLRGEVILKGKTAPVPTFRIDGLRSVPDSVRGLAGIHASRIDRQSEWEQLLAAVNRLPAGRGQIVCMTGEAGLGKSRLKADLNQSIDHATLCWIEGHCLSYTESVGFGVFREVVWQLLGATSLEGEASEVVRAALTRWLAAEEAETAWPYVADFLNLPLPEAARERLRYLDAEAVQRRTFVALQNLIEARARAMPLVLVLDDLHWIDQASIALLDYLLRLVDQVPLLLLLIYRPERTKPCWQIQERVLRDYAHCAVLLALANLSAGDHRELLAALVDVEQLPDETRALILERTEGNPLYLEEVLRTLIDDQVLIRADGRWSMRRDVDRINVPDTLQGVMMARLDRMEEPARRLARVASVVGRSFSWDILAHLDSTDTSHLNAQLVRLQQHEIISEVQRAPLPVYMFQHTMMHEVYYNSLAVRARRLYHTQIAAYLEAHHGDVSLIAQHAYLGQDWLRALRYQLRAGQQAQRLFAQHEAIDHFEKALACASNLPLEDYMPQRQIAHAALGELLTTLGRYEEAGSHLLAARVEAQAAQDRDGEVRAIRWLAHWCQLRGEFAMSADLVDQALEVLAGAETAEAIQLHLLAGLIQARQGQFDQAAEQAQTAQRLAEAQQEPIGLARAYRLLAQIATQRGDNRRAIDQAQQAVQLCEQAGDLEGQATALNLLANAYFNAGQWAPATRTYHEVRRRFEQLGDVYQRAFADNNLGEIARHQGCLDEALNYYQAALRGMEQIGGSAYTLGVLHNNLGAVYIRRGEWDIARQQLRLSRSHFEEAQARDILPELLRHEAEIALAQGEAAAASLDARHSLELAQELGLRSEAAMAQRVLGEIALAQNDLTSALDLLQDSAAILDELGETYQAARTRLLLGKVCLARGQIVAARKEIERCLPIFEQLEIGPDAALARELFTNLAQAS